MPDKWGPVHDWHTLWFVQLDLSSYIKSLWLTWLLITWEWDIDRHRPVWVRIGWYPWGGD